MEPLPIDPSLPAIVAALEQHRCVVVEAPPGAGKTTRVPPALLPMLAPGDRQVVVLEPRRIAARLAAVRVAHELEQPVGRQVGYQVRFENVSGPDTRVRFVTEGVLVRQLVSDPELRRVGVIVLDEFHERHIHGDLALSVAARLRSGPRPDLGIVVMSATLESAPIARFLGDCPVVSVQGRRFEVRIDHLERPDDRPLQDQVAAALRGMVRQGLRGSVLVFLPGAQEIRKALETCGPVARDAGLDLVTLHGEMPAAEQDRAVAPSARPKVILATNVAETSLTIEGVVAVIDSGLARIAGHAPWSGLPTLRVMPISKASAAQRAGRAGRTGPGQCLRLYTRADHDRRRDHDLPEIQRADLAETVLTLAGLGVRAPAAFGWFEPPPGNALAAAVDLLRLLGAIDECGALTATGHSMLRFPVHPRTARLLVEAEKRGVERDACVLAALLGERDLDLSRRVWMHGEQRGRNDSRGDSDLTSALARFEEASNARFEPSALRAMQIDIGAARAVDRAARHLASLVRTQAPPARDRDESLRIALLAAYPDRVARRVRAEDLALAQGGSASLSPSSEVKDAEFLVAVDAEERQDGKGRRNVVRLASAIEPEWILDLFADRVAETVEVAWNESLERVEVSERLLWLSLVLDETHNGRASEKEAARVLADRALLAGPAAFAPEGTLDGLLARIAFVRQSAPELGLPAIDEDTAREVLRQLCEGRRSFEQLRHAGLIPALLARIEPALRAQLDSFAPERISLPSGRSLIVHYEQRKPPWVESRLQDFFGMKQGPTIARGRFPLVVHLLAPNHRAVQLTSDLAGFWERTYPSVRKELCRKYPKHDWPSDGRTATPPPPGRLRAPRG